MEESIQYFDTYEENLQREVLKMCTSLGMLDGELLSSEDIDQKWKEWAPEYIAVALPEVNSYPDFAIACAGYAGMAAANWWDKDWGKHHGAEFGALLGPRGFDDMDEHIISDILGLPLNDDVAKWIEKTIRICAQTAISKIRHEQIEPQSIMAFHIFSKATKVMFKIGAAIELHRLGYKLQKINLHEC